MSQGKSTLTHRLVHETRGDLKVGDVVQDFRGEDVTVEGWSSGEAWSSNGGTGRVHTDRGTFYPSVIKAQVVK